MGGDHIFYFSIAPPEIRPKYLLTATGDAYTRYGAGIVISALVRL
jgi:hypothetical protein